jgi:micrococcal nuclease
MLKRIWLFLSRLFGPPVKVIDGDTVQINGVAIRLAGVDAPELKQKGGKESKAFLEWLIKQAGRLSYRVKSIDKYGRTVGVLIGQGCVDLNQQVVREGQGHHYAEFPNGYAADEEYAKRHHKGIWSSGEKLMKPKDWRKKFK